MADNVVENVTDNVSENVRVDEGTVAVIANVQGAIDPQRTDYKNCLSRFLHLGKIYPYHICSGRETPLDEIVESLDCINSMIRPKMEWYPYEVIKMV